jgi:ATP-binding cassette subfamily A (ABC1) protein 5
MLTAEEPIGCGQAAINGYDVGTQAHKCWESLGFCPQHDALWPEIKTSEHLILFAVIKNQANPRQVAEDMMRRLDLTEHADKPSDKLSGGNRRKLSAAIAMVGRPKVMFLDEPSSGMDVATRRNMWTVISQSLSQSSVVLTTHSMEEADALSSRIAIMVNGALRCIGTGQQLKQKFGTGYILEVSLPSHAKQSEATAVQEFVQRVFVGAEVTDTFVSRLKFVLPPQPGMGLAALFRELEEHKAKVGIESYTVSQPTLEQIFLDISAEQLPEQENAEVGEG